MAAPVCGRCRRGITGPRRQALGASWHPACFACAGCGRPLEGGFVERAGQGWHPACHEERFGLRCSVCGQVIQGQYFQVEGRPVCGKDYQERVGPRCAICGQVITGPFLANALGQNICQRHGAARACFSCARWLTEVEQAQGLYAPFGTALCGRCQPGRIDAAALGAYGHAFGAAALGELGLALGGPREVPIRLEPLEALRRLQSPVQAQAEGLTQTYVETSGGRETARGVRAILVAGGLAKEHFEGVLAHEFGHVWLFQEGRAGVPEAAAEGFCELVRHRWLARLGTPLAQELRERLEANHDPIYGEGFRRNKLSWERTGLPGVLALLRP